MDRMDNPQLDLMVSSGQTQQSLDTNIWASRDLHRSCAGPTRSPSSLVYPGDSWLLVWHQEQVRLACVAKLIEGTEPASGDVKFTCQWFSHTMPEDDNPPDGFWGTWQQSVVTNLPKAKTATSHEACIRLVQTADGAGWCTTSILRVQGATRRLRVQTLRVAGGDQNRARFFAWFGTENFIRHRPATHASLLAPRPDGWDWDAERGQKLRTPLVQYTGPTATAHIAHN